MRIIYFDLDCLRPDHLGCYGYQRPTSPAIDAIAKQGVIFEHYNCSSSPCLPSRAALFSGRFGIRNGVCANEGIGNKFYLRTNDYWGTQPDNEMFVRQLRRHGYDTISFSNFADRHNAFWFMCGWSEYHTPNLKGGGELAEEVNVPVLNWLKHNGARENYFLHINYWDAHRPYHMDPSWLNNVKDAPIQKWPDEKLIKEHGKLEGRFTAMNIFPNGKSKVPQLMPGCVASREDFKFLINGYDAAIAYINNHMKVVLDELDRQGLLDDTAIIVSGDHGDAFGEHGIYSDHVCADECIHRVPFVIKWPGVSKPGHKSAALLYNVDFAPTICDLLGIPPAEDWDGKSFKEHIQGKPGIDRDYIVWDHSHYPVQRCVRTKTHLFMRTYDPHGYHFKPVELYNMVEDPYQEKDVSAQYPEIVKECSYLMNEWIHEQRAKGFCIPDPLEETLRERGRLEQKSPKFG